ncbi:MAG TPA: N-acetyltransferase [Brevibacterium sp.]|nr:N-acetyltransferase [Brevibacterium sp.]
MTKSPARVADDAVVDERARLLAGTVVWNLSQVREGAVVGKDCTIGRNVYIGAGVQVADRVKIQNNCLIYEPAFVESGVFIGPAVVFTNDAHPRAITPSGQVKAASDWDAVGVTVRQGASIGARAVCVAPVEVGRWALVAAGAVVTRDVPNFAMVAGVPAAFKGWVGKTGRRLQRISDSSFRCPDTGEIFSEIDGDLEEEGCNK